MSAGQTLLPELVSGLDAGPLRPTRARDRWLYLRGSSVEAWTCSTNLKHTFRLIMPPTVSARKRLSASVRLLRTQKGISGDQFARNVGISRNTLYLIENKAANASLGTIERLSRILEVEPASLLDTPSKLLTHTAQPGLRRALAQRADGYLRELAALNISHYRQQRGLTQQALVQAAGLADGYVSLVERTAPDLGLDMLEKLAMALRVNVKELLATA